MKSSITEALKCPKRKAKQPFKPTKHIITRWFNILNYEIFDNGLYEYEEVTIKKLRGVWAWNHCLMCEEGKKSSRLDMNHRFDSFELFLNILAHEMVHAFQWQELGLNDHDDTFWAWQRQLKKHGLILEE